MQPSDTCLQRSRRLWIIDRLAGAIGRAAREGLGSTIQRHVQNAAKQSTTASKELSKITVTEDELLHEWELQREDQLSVRSRK